MKGSICSVCVCEAKNKLNTKFFCVRAIKNKGKKQEEEDKELSDWICLPLCQECGQWIPVFDCHLCKEPPNNVRVVLFSIVQYHCSLFCDFICDLSVNI